MPDPQLKPPVIKPVVWFVSANGAHRGGLKSVLMPLYHVETFASPNEAILSTGSLPAVVIADELSPPRDGVGCILLLREIDSLGDIPMLFMSSRDDAKMMDLAAQSGADRFLAKPYRRSALLNAVSALSNKAIEDSWRGLPEFPRNALQRSVDAFRGLTSVVESKSGDAKTGIDFMAVMNACGPILDAVSSGQIREILSGLAGHDNYLFAHALRVASLLGLFGMTIGLPRDRQLVLATGGLLLDVGKLAIPPDILNKPGRLSDGEMEVLRSHVGLSMKFLGQTEGIPRGILTIAEQHHERLDQSGYPNGLGANQINDLSRMAAIVDVFCGLTDQRVYKIGLSTEKAVALMTTNMAGQLDPQMLGLFGSRLLGALGATVKAAS